MFLINKLRNTFKKYFRNKKYSRKNNIFDKTVFFGEDTHLVNTKWESYSGCNKNCRIVDSWVGKYTNISWNVTIAPREHMYTNFTIHDFVYLNKEYIMNDRIFDNYLVKIGHDVWIGCHVIILAGVEVGNGAIIAAGSVITKSVPSYAVVGGNPAKFIKWRFDKDKIKKLEELNWYEWDKDETFNRKEELQSLVGFNISEFKERYFSPKKFMDTKEV